MPISSIDHGSQAATLDVEHTLSTQTVPGTYTLVTDMTNMAAGDIVKLRIKTKVVHDGASGLAYEGVFAGPQLEIHKYSIPIPVDTEIICTLEQTDGTGRAFPWSLLRI